MQLHWKGKADASKIVKNGLFSYIIKEFILLLHLQH